MFRPLFKKQTHLTALAQLFMLMALVLLSLFSPQVKGAIQQAATPCADSAKTALLRIMFYNVENLFDTLNDPAINDDEFTPEGVRRWNGWKFHQKTNNLFKVIAAAGIDGPPAIVAFAEIENRFVIERLARGTFLSKYNYEIIHFDSPDPRGIDVGLMFRPDILKPLTSVPLPVCYPGEKERCSRDILYFAFLIGQADTVHLFVNHWPSRYRGKKTSEPLRIIAARALIKPVDSLLQLNPCAKIIALGDFNDEPQNRSMRDVLGAKQPLGPYRCTLLYNLAWSSQLNHPGTLKYKGTWNIFDQAVVSGGLLQGSTLYTLPEKFTIFNASFLLMPDERYMGARLYRTYNGYRYAGGFSDHLPILIDLVISPQIILF